MKPPKYSENMIYNGPLVGLNVAPSAKIVPNDPAMRYICNNNVAYFYMYDQNQWRWCGFVWINEF
jgi:hypothetical protein